MSLESFLDLDIPELLGLLEVRRLLGPRVLTRLRDLFYRRDYTEALQWEWPTVDSLLISLRHSGEKDDEKRRSRWTEALCFKLVKGSDEASTEARQALEDFVQAFDTLKQRLETQLAAARQMSLKFKS